MVLLVVIAVISSIGLLSIVVSKLYLYFTKRNRRNRFKDWELDDLLLIRPNTMVGKTLNSNGKEYGVLAGWTDEHLYINMGDGTVQKTKWSVLELNKSAYWRQNYDEVKKIIKKEPKFPRKVIEKSPTKTSEIGKGKTYDGKDIELLTEIECQVYLKKAIEEEDYSTAELLRKRMENFR
jgi:hypothetical protein